MGYDVLSVINCCANNTTFDKWSLEDLCLQVYILNVKYTLIINKKSAIRIIEYNIVTTKRR